MPPGLNAPNVGRRHRARGAGGIGDCVNPHAIAAGG